MNPMYPTITSCQPQGPTFFQAPVNNYILPPFMGDVISSQNSCNSAVTLTVTGLQNTPFSDRSRMVEGSLPVFNDQIDKLEWKTIVQIFQENPSLIPQISANTNGLQATSQKGLANGYAGLDTNIKVPLINLPIMVGATASSVGLAGIVPAPAVNPNPGSKILFDDGQWKSLSNTQVLTTKGDLLTRDGSSLTDVRLPVGLTNQYLTVDPTTTTGLKYTDGPILTVSSPSNLPATLLSNTLYIATSNFGVYANVGGVTSQLNKLTGYTEFLQDTAITGSYTVNATGNDYVQVAPLSPYTQNRIVNLTTSGVTKGYKVTFGAQKLTIAQLNTFKYLVAAQDFDGSSSTELPADSFAEFIYTGSSWIRSK